MNHLNKLIENFLKQYTFNNIDILLGHRKILNLEKEALSKKLIERKRGGYCFENNQYFFNLLKDEGFIVRRYLGRVVYGGSSEVPRTHQLSVVTIDQKEFIADVGFGPYTPGISVPMSGEEVVAFNGNRYRVVKLNKDDYQLETKRGEEYFSLYQFNQVEYNDADFKLSNYYTNTHQDSKFTKSLMLSALDKKGVKFISNLLFSTLFEGKREDVEIKTSEQFTNIIKEQFHVSYSDEELEALFEIVSEFKTL